MYCPKTVGLQPDIARVKSYDSRSDETRPVNRLPTVATTTVVSKIPVRLTPGALQALVGPLPTLRFLFHCRGIAHLPHAVMTTAVTGACGGCTVRSRQRFSGSAVGQAAPWVPSSCAHGAHVELFKHPTGLFSLLHQCLMQTGPSHEHRNLEPTPYLLTT